MYMNDTLLGQLYGTVSDPMTRDVPTVVGIDHHSPKPGHTPGMTTSTKPYASLLLTHEVAQPTSHHLCLTK